MNIKLLLLIVWKCNSMCPPILSWFFKTAIIARELIKTINVDSKVPLNQEAQIKMFFSCCWI